MKMQLHWQEVRKEWQQNQRLRLGGMVIAILVSGVLFLWLGDYLTQLSKEVQQQQQRQVRLERLAQQKNWPERVAQVQEQRTQLEAHLWQAESLGLAQAAVQSWFAEQLVQLQLQGLQVDVGQPEAVSPDFIDLWRLPIEVQGVLSRHQMIQVLNSFESHQNLIKVTRFKFLPARGALRIHLQLQTYFKIAEEVSL